MTSHIRFVYSTQEMKILGLKKNNEGSIVVLNNVKYALLFSVHKRSVWKDSNGFIVQC